MLPEETGDEWRPRVHHTLLGARGPSGVQVTVSLSLSVEAAPASAPTPSSPIRSPAVFLHPFCSCVGRKHCNGVCAHTCTHTYVVSTAAPPICSPGIDPVHLVGALFPGSFYRFFLDFVSEDPSMSCAYLVAHPVWPGKARHVSEKCTLSLPFLKKI